ncbi:selenocysteine insertion sequence-binding protein 2 isoform X6 [Sagmatias obliquidens]|uniref:selenocysteine insertion sequence-binding protein 2 isoform X6 n=1 Tax=Sagmatias obliquidens TaxID=3371155 RepID=UPI000F4445A2|nr:selenocysteine insertion sequence-binding protein 2 isoform X6 [Lagenorhynchus obliquidens]XP_030688373.1 selenocysteine insertion sequence-binding protein 2 isoform X6 [Globicephala melas]
MASEGPREPAGEGIKLSADVKPFVPKFAGLSVAWSEPSEARVFPSCAATTYYPCVQELAVPEFELVEMEEHELPISSRQKLYAEDMAFGASTFPPQYLSPEIPLHPYAYSPYTLESSQNVCPVPGSQYDYNQPGCFGGFQTVKPRNEHVCPLPQDTKALFKKKTCDEQKFDTKKTDGPISSDLKSVKSSPRMSIHAENSLKSDGYYKRTDRKSRIIEKSGSASKPEFEFTRLDFPELQGRENSEIPEIQKQLKWGPLRSASTDVSLLREVGKPAAVLAEGETVVKNNNRTGSVTDNAATSPSSCTRDPKNGSMSSSEVLSSEPSYKEKHVVHPTKKSRASQGDDPEQNEASRKNKKKKEKSKSKYEVLTVQEPPRIEDAEEFPNLAVASERRDRVESPKFQSKQQPQNNFKSSGKKSQIPVQLDLGGMLTALEKKQHSQNAKQSSKPVVFSVGAVPVLSKDSMSGKKGHRFGQVKTPHNPLDSSAPLMKKGKQREVPKAKKPTSLKKIILKERQERKQQRLQENAVSPAFASDDVQDGESGGDDQALGQPDPSGGTEELVSCASVAESKSEDQLGAEPQKEVDACPKIHSRRFRDYCSQMLSKEVDACVTDLLKELVRFQDRMYQKDPVKAKTKRRLVLGLREVLKHLKLKKLKCVIISPNCEKIQSKGGLDDTLHTIIDYACEQNIPFVFALNRKALGRSLNKAVPVSVVGIFSYDGAQDQFHKMVELTMAARQAYRTMLENAHWELPGEPGPLAPASPPTQGPSCSAENRPLAPAGKEEPHYIEIWRNHLEAYTRRALELEESLEASTSQMMNLNL